MPLWNSPVLPYGFLESVLYWMIGLPISLAIMHSTNTPGSRGSSMFAMITSNAASQSIILGYWLNVKSQSYADDGFTSMCVSIGRHKRYRTESIVHFLTFSRHVSLFWFTLHISSETMHHCSRLRFFLCASHVLG